MPGLQHETVYEYTGKPDDHGIRGRLQICRVTLGDAAVQPSHDTLPSAAGQIVLNSGCNIPRIGLGTWKSEKGQVRSAVYEAVKAGYRHVDCAAIYENEHEVGSALQQAFSEKLVRRQDIFLTSKLWNTHHSAQRVRKACLKTLSDLQLEYLDLYLIHWPVTGNVGTEVVPSIQETWRAMEELVKDGLVHSIGVSNFSVKKLQDIFSYAEVPPAVSQVECHPYFRNEDMLQWCKSNQIHVTAYSPLGSPDSASMFKRKAPLLLQDPAVGAVANKMGRSPAQVLIRWALQHGTSVLPKSTSADRIKANLDVMGWELSHEDYHKLCNLPGQMRMVNGSFWLHPRGPYKTLHDLWDDDTSA
ncbi:hypothetical protein WJX79_009089 [Trebouxia sp. C0005]